MLGPPRARAMLVVKEVRVVVAHVFSFLLQVEHGVAGGAAVELRNGGAKRHLASSAPLQDEEQRTCSRVKQGKAG
jgi:hypothetical protein